MSEKPIDFGGEYNDNRLRKLAELAEKPTDLVSDEDFYRFMNLPPNPVSAFLPDPSYTPGDDPPSKGPFTEGRKAWHLEDETNSEMSDADRAKRAEEYERFLNEQHEKGKRFWKNKLGN